MALDEELLRDFHGDLTWLPADAHPLEDAVHAELEAIYQELARRSLWDFLRYWFLKRQLTLVESWYLRYACEIGEAVVRGDPEWRDTVVNMPPRSLKSELFTVAMPAYALGVDYTPASSCVNVSYSGSLAWKHSGMSLAIVRSEWYRAVFPHVQLHPKKQAVQEWWTVDAKTGIVVAERSAAGVDGDTTGRGGDLIVVDDLLKPKDANSEALREKANVYLGETLTSRRNNPRRARRLVTAQRLHEDDPCGHLIKQARAGGTPWKHVCIPNEAEKRTIYSIGSYFHERAPGELMCPERIDRKTTDQLKKEMGPNYSGQYQQRPTKLEGDMLKPRWLQRFQKDPVVLARERGLRTVMTIDYAGSAQETIKNDPDNHAIGIFAKDSAERLYWLDEWAEQCGPEDVAAAIIELQEKWRCVQRYTEKGALKNVIGSVLLNECLRRKVDPIHVEGIYLPGDIVERVQVSRGQLAVGTVWVPEAAPWLAAVEEEMRTFPLGKRDDRIQTFAIAGHVFKQLRLPAGGSKSRPPSPPGVITGNDLLEEHERLEREGKVPLRHR